MDQNTTKNENDEDAKFSKENSEKRLTILHLVTFACVCLAGSLFIALSYLIPSKEEEGSFENFLHLCIRDIGITFFPLGIISFIYEFILRGNFLIEMQKKIKLVMPGRYSNMRKAGIVDAYPALDIVKMGKELEEVEDCDIRILDIWMENYNRIEKILKDAAVLRNCKVRILLWDPRETPALDGRCKTLEKMETRNMQDMIKINIRWIMETLKVLSPEEKENFQVKLYKNFISISMIGYGSEFQIGHYLRGRVSSMGSQIKVAGEQHFFYKELKKHFDNEWKNPENTLLDEAVYEEIKNI